MTRFLGGWIAVAVLVAATTIASAQTAPAEPEEKSKTLVEELVVFGYIEKSYVFNLRGGNQNELRFYEDPSDQFPSGFGLIWKGLFSRVEYLHDQANENVFRVRSSGATSKAQDTITVALHYLFF